MPEAKQSSTPPKSKKIDWKNIIIWVLIGGVVVGVFAAGFYHYQVKSEKTAAKQAKLAKLKDKSAEWRSYKNTEYKYLLKSPDDWYESTDTNVVSEENNIVYHFYAVSKEKEQTQGAGDQVMVVRYLEGDPCAGMTVTKSDTTFSGYKAKRDDCYKDGKLKVTLYSFPDTSKNEWFIVSHIDKNLEIVEKIASTFTFLD